jgi:hypothetical protein
MVLLKQFKGGDGGPRYIAMQNNAANVAEQLRINQSGGGDQAYRPPLAVANDNLTNTSGINVQTIFKDLVILKNQSVENGSLDNKIGGTMRRRSRRVKFTFKKRGAKRRTMRRTMRGTKRRAKQRVMRKTK